ncbi:hypothetical protein NYP18_11345 [Corynebacterium sp. YIM 101645]|uniref:GP-PDE domain-containing protein n=1 Tax=Corynebacterium lemuris TaxID=1859292 RepID=A0ABT2FYL9_9CORY|nr:glycerophosphodiester phosphodiesterase family protein [Corynebacterium lemuris]MCS5480251.1 hypothetical protein [Corynebacterium lemuris]
MWVVAHRGAENQELENTLAAFRKAAELGADAVEMDVHATFDHEVVVLHDTTAARVAAAGSPFAEVPVAGLRLEQVRRIRLRNGEGIPTLAEVTAAMELPMHAGGGEECGGGGGPPGLLPAAPGGAGAGAVDLLPRSGSR